MWTLYNQPERKNYEYDFEDINILIDEIKTISKIKKLDYNQVLETYKYLEDKRRNDLYLANWDIFDEQISWFWQIIEAWLSNIDNSLDYLCKK